MSFVLRWLFAALLVVATYNPTEWNYVRWVMANGRDHMPLAVILGQVLLVGYVIYLRATLRSIGAFGMFLVLGQVAAVVWLLSDLGLVDLSDGALITWIVLLALSLVLGIGLSWSIVRRRLSGQADVDDVED